MNETAEKWCSIKEIAAHLGVSRDTVLNWIAKKNMPAHKVGKLWKFQVSEVNEWIRSGGSANE
ncbi:MAG: helix-turn-helix domain-containing protein [Oscillospiraceae bacterium]|nr:helix-turn-helix domain-containing protein [Oscillospiraceae bacterium]